MKGPLALPTACLFFLLCILFDFSATQLLTFFQFNITCPPVTGTA